MASVPSAQVPSPTPDLLHSRLLAAWPSLGVAWGDGDKVWTQRLFDWFRKEGKALGFEVYPDKDLAWHHEYLNDLIWCVESGDAYGGLILAIESEWSQDWSDVLEDFDKLLDVKSPLKVLVCDPTGTQLERLPQAISLQIQGHMHKTAGESYLVLAFTPTAIRAWAFDHQGTSRTLGVTPYPRG